jgi:hypothetical protein
MPQTLEALTSSMDDVFDESVTANLLVQSRYYEPLNLTGQVPRLEPVPGRRSQLDPMGRQLKPERRDLGRSREGRFQI